MGLASALNTALTGLTASETTIDVVGNNLANSGTVGFKASTANFATQFLQTRGLGSAPSDTSGGTNPRQVGLGVQVAEITPDFTQGTVQVSSSPSDLAIQGDGFFMVQGGQNDILYTRNGIFKTNSANELVTITGQKLLGYGIDDKFNIQSTSLQPLTIPLGAEAVAAATQNVFFEGTLTPTGDIANTAEIIQSAVLGDSRYDKPTYPTSSSDLLIVSPPTTGSFAGASSGAGTDLAAGTYNYKVVYYDANGNETTSSTISVNLAAGASGIDLSAIPTNNSGDYVGRRIFRTVADAPSTGTYYLVADAADQTATTFTDTITDAALVANPEFDGSALNGQYSYYITYYNPSIGQESRPSSLVGPLNVGGGRIRLDNLPQPTGDFPTPPSTIRIYRNTAGQSSTFYRIDDIDPASVSGGKAYVDYTADTAITANPTLDFDGPKINTNTLLTDVVKRDGNNYVQLFGLGTLSFAGSKGGRTLSAKEFTITPTSTVQDLVDFMSDAMGIQVPDASNGIPADAFTGNNAGSYILSNGKIQFIGNNGVDNAVSIGLADFKFTATGSTDTTTVNMGFNSTQTAKGQTAVADFIVYDSLGVPLNVRVTAVLESRDNQSTVYRWYADSSGNAPRDGSSQISVGSGLIRFDAEGNVIEGNSMAKVSIDRENINAVSPLEFNLDFSKLSGLASNKSTLAASRQDGSAQGTLSSYIIGEDGVIRGVFSNGVSRDLGQLILARFANPAGLEQRGENLFAAGVNSGLAIQGRPGEQGIGSVIAGAVELSNTDIGKNLIDLILASSQYRGNTRVITTAQQLLDELLNIRR
ncbi:MAG: flagellar hook-basal body complex protein [Pirellulales bacterium]